MSMAQTKIDQDVGRFKRIIRGRVRENLKKYITQGEMMGKQGKDVVSIPIPQIDIPRFKLDGNKGGGVGSGDGEPGDPVSGQQGQGSGAGQAGDQEGQHALEVELTFDEFVEIMAEELELPRIEPKGNEQIQSLRGRYRGITYVGPNSLRHFKRTYKEALKHQISAGQYDPEDPIIIPIRQDQRYRRTRPPDLHQLHHAQDQQDRQGAVARQHQHGEHQRQLAQHQGAFRGLRPGARSAGQEQRQETQVQRRQQPGRGLAAQPGRRRPARKKQLPADRAPGQVPGEVQRRQQGLQAFVHGASLGLRPAPLKARRAESDFRHHERMTAGT